MKIKMEINGSVEGDCDILLTNLHTGEKFDTIFQGFGEGTYLYAKDIRKLMEFCGAEVIEESITQRIGVYTS